MGIKLKQNNGNLAFAKERVRPVEEVFVGDTAPTEDKGYKVWVDPTGESIEVITRQELDEAIAGIETPDVDLTDYYTKEEVDNKFENIDIPDVDLTDYALKSEIPNVSAFQTEEQVKSLIDLALEEVENGAY